MTDNKELDSHFKETDCTSDNNNLLKMIVLTTLLIIRDLEVGETEHMQICRCCVRYKKYLWRTC